MLVVQVELVRSVVTILDVAAPLTAIPGMSFCKLGLDLPVKRLDVGVVIVILLLAERTVAVLSGIGVFSPALADQALGQDIAAIQAVWIFVGAADVVASVCIEG
jgi:hypothetical protein